MVFCWTQDARDAGEDDIEAILAEIISKEKQQTAVSVTKAVTAVNATGGTVFIVSLSKIYM